MADEETVPAGEVEARQTETNAHNLESDAVESGEEAGDDQEAEAEPEEIELDFAGNKRKFPANATLKEIAADLEAYNKGLWSGHTKRSQEIADKARHLESEMSAVQKLRGMNEQLLDQYSQGRIVGSELRQLEQVDLNELWESDPDRARQVSDRINQTRAKFNQIVNNVQQTETALSSEEARSVSQQSEQGRQVVLKAIPDFEASLPALKEYAVKHGVTEAEVDNWGSNPFAAIAVYKAKKYDDLMSKAGKATQPRAAAPVKPMPSTGSSSSPKLDLNKDAEKIPIDEWRRQRQQQRDSVNKRPR